MLRGKNDALERDHNGRAWMAWHVAALQRAKKMPKLDKMLHRARSKVMSPEAMLSTIRVINAALGGKTIDGR